eukprot:3677328-Karenia_brevis.AAC.1
MGPGVLPKGKSHKGKGSASLRYTVGTPYSKVEELESKQHAYDFLWEWWELHGDPNDPNEEDDGGAD